MPKARHLKIQIIKMPCFQALHIINTALWPSIQNTSGLSCKFNRFTADSFNNYTLLPYLWQELSLTKTYRFFITIRTTADPTTTATQAA